MIFSTKFGTITTKFRTVSAKFRTVSTKFRAMCIKYRAVSAKFMTLSTQFCQTDSERPLASRQLHVCQSMFNCVCVQSQFISKLQLCPGFVICPTYIYIHALSLSSISKPHCIQLPCISMLYLCPISRFHPYPSSICVPCSPMSKLNPFQISIYILAVYF